jgi:hypothetical protein
MSENQNQQQVALRIDESKMHQAYANTIRTTSTGDELILDFGINMPMNGPNNEQMMLFSVGSRVIMNWMAAKRLAMSLVQAVQQYESVRGEINVNPQQGKAR